MYYLSLDFGTSSVKAAIVDEDRQIVQTAKAPYAYRILPGGKNELPENDLRHALAQAMSCLDEKYRNKIGQICYDTFSPSPVFMSKEGELIGHSIITHLDRRSSAYAERIDKQFGNYRYMNTAGILPFPGGCSLMTILWMMDHCPEIIKNTHQMGHLPTYIHFLLCGKWAVDRVNASMMGLYCTVSDTGWSDEILDCFHIRKDLLPSIVQPGKNGGVLLPQMAGSLGLAAGIPVSFGTNDMAASQVGAGNRQSGCILNSAGSSDMVSILTDKPVVSSEYYLRAAADPGLWQIYATTVGGFAVDWFYEQFCQDMPEKETYYRWLENSILEFFGKTNVTFDPYLAGDRQSLEGRSAAWHGLTLATNRGEMAVAMLQAIQNVLFQTVLSAKESIKVSHQIKLTGGMLSDAYTYMKKKVFQDFDIHLIKDASLIGNVILAQSYT